MTKKIYDRTDGEVIYAAGMEALRDAGQAMHRQEIFKAVEQRVALKPDDRRENKSNNEPHWKMRVGLNLSMSKNAGHVEKLGKGKWCITASGLQHMQTPNYQAAWHKLIGK